MDFYFNELSPPCRSVLLTAKAVGAKLNKKPVDLQKKEHLKPEYIKINPQHTIPTLVDGDLKLNESRAICTYLASKQGKDEFYPKEPKERAVVDNLLYFDQGTLSRRLADYVQPVMLKDEKPDPEMKERLEEALKWLNDKLEKKEFSAGSKLTVADFVLIAPVSSIVEAELADISKHKNIKKWADKCKSKMSGYDSENGKGAKAYAEIAKPKFSDSEDKKEDDKEDEKEDKKEDKDDDKKEDQKEDKKEDKKDEKKEDKKEDKKGEKKDEKKEEKKEEKKPANPKKPPPKK